MSKQLSEEERLKIIYEKAYAFLESKGGRERLENEFAYYLNIKVDSLNQVFKRMVNSLKNKAGYAHYIADIDGMADILANFDPLEVKNQYHNDWHNLFNAYRGKYSEKYKMDATNPRSSWVIFSKGVLSGANFLSQFKSKKDFDGLIDSFSANEYTLVALPMYIDKEVFGFGFPLACDFLKELGYRQFGKPDVHLIDIFEGLNIVCSRDEFAVFRAIVRMAKAANTYPVLVDKALWIIGSGKWKREFGEEINMGRQKEAFIEMMRREYREVCQGEATSPAIS